MNYVEEWLQEATSTNSLLRQRAAAGPTAAPHGLLLGARAQSGGRGQRGNAWEAAPGMNLTFSLLLRPGALVAPRCQFLISQGAALAVADAARAMVPEAAERFAVKWPNDVYWADRKLAGILIEHSLTSGQIQWTVVGVGLNVNQVEFHSDAPNPVSLAQIAGREVPLRHALEAFREAFSRRWAQIEKGRGEELAADYMRALWRGRGLWPWRDCRDGSHFTASVASVAPDGVLTLREPSGALRSFAFKEVSPGDLTRVRW